MRTPQHEMLLMCSQHLCCEARDLHTLGLALGLSCRKGTVVAGSYCFLFSTQLGNRNPSLVARSLTGNESTTNSTLLSIWLLRPKTLGLFLSSILFATGTRSHWFFAEAGRIGERRSVEVHHCGYGRWPWNLVHEATGQSYVFDFSPCAEK